MKVEKKSHIEIQELDEDLAERISRNSLVQWVTENPKFFLYLCLALLVLFLIIIRWTTGNWFKTESDYIKAESDFASLKQLPIEDKTGTQARILSSLKEIINVHPELHSKYDAEIAQILIARGKPSEDVIFVTNSFEHSPNLESSSLNFYKEFSKTTLLIEEGQYEKALQRALALKQDLINKAQETQETGTRFRNGLFAYNLLRIAFLRQQLNDAEELATWQEWKQYANGKKIEQSNLIDAQVFRDIATQFEENDISLREYIQFREGKLSS